jgi:hypothetical protein
MATTKFIPPPARVRRHLARLMREVELARRQLTLSERAYAPAVEHHDQESQTADGREAAHAAAS